MARELAMRGRRAAMLSVGGAASGAGASSSGGGSYSQRVMELVHLDAARAVAVERVE